MENRNDNNASSTTTLDADFDQDQIARRAYQLYETRGGEPGHEIEDWLRAEDEINQQRAVIHRD